MILTTTGLVAARDIKLGDKLVTVDIQILEKEGKTDKFSFKANDLRISTETVETEVTNIIPGSTTDRVFFNNDESTKFTGTHPIFIKRDSEYQVIEASNIVEGDVMIVFNSDKITSEIQINKVTHQTLTEASGVYTFSCDPYNWYFAGNILVHNK
jgi:hypothetical protein